MHKPLLLPEAGLRAQAETDRLSNETALYPNHTQQFTTSCTYHDIVTLLVLLAVPTVLPQALLVT